MNLRTRIALATSAALALVAVVSAIVIWGTLRNELLGTVEHQLRGVAARATGGRGFDDDRFRPPPAETDRFGGPTGYRQFVTASGEVIQDEGNSAALPVNAEDRAIASSGSGHHVRDTRVDGVHLLIFTAGADGGAVQVARPLAEADRVLNRAAIALTLIAAAGIAVAALLGFLVAGVALRPVSRFTAEAEEIASDTTARRRLDAHGDDEVSRLAASFNRTLDALERSVDQQRRLIADAGHELRTPIASIRANIQLLDDADRLPPEDVVAVRSDIVSELDELTELLADVIELARGADPDAPHDQVRIDHVVRDATARAQRRGGTDVRFELDVEPTVVVGDAARISRAVTNVLDNARKFSPGSGTVEVGLRDGVLRVRDHGPGIPTDDLPHVFERFYRSDAARGLPGSGLGLAIVQQTVTSHGGSVRITNGAGGGAVVELGFGHASRPEDELDEV